MKKISFIIGGIVVLSVLAALIVKTNKGYVPYPLWVRSTLHSIAPPSDLYRPIILDAFQFSETGFTRSYVLKPKYLDFYEIGFIDEQQQIPKEYRFSGKIKVEYFSEGKLITEEIIDKARTYWHADQGPYYKNISLTSFSVPLEEKYIKDMSVRLTVLKADEALSHLSKFIKLYIRVNMTP